MRFSTRVTRALIAATPLGAALLSVGSALLVGWDQGKWLVVPGFLLLAGGVASVHTVLTRRYGGLGLLGFGLTESSFVLIALFGLGFVTLAVANPIYGYALWRMEPPFRVSAVALFAVWPIAAVVAAATSLEFIEALAVLFSLPYAPLAVETLRLRET